ncbi:MAG: ion transporter [Alphaproteobacteria bacterium]
MVRPNALKDVEFKGLRGIVAALIERAAFSHFITAVILINAVTLGLETNATIMQSQGALLHMLDKIALGIFVVELLLKLFVYRLSFFRAGWNVFDFVIVGIALIPASGPLAVLRALRVLRVLRLVSVVPSMRRVIAALLHSIPGMASIMAVLLVIYYVCSVLATKLFSAHPVAEIAEKFESIPASMYTLFQVMTLEGWSQEIVRPVMDVYPYAWLFFIPFIIVTSFAVLNLFIGIIVDAMNIIHERGDYIGPERRKDNVRARDEIAGLRKDIAELKALVAKK